MTSSKTPIKPPRARQVAARKKNAGNEYSHRNQIEIIRGGRDYFSLLVKLIEEAQQAIHLQTYILNNDNTGTMVADALKRACHRGVTVHLLVDGYASQRLPRRFIVSLKEAGVHFRFFEPFLKSKHFYFGRRLHHKVFVSDGAHALVGGINIADRYNDTADEAAWLDFALYVHGEIAQDLCKLCWKTWNGFPAGNEQVECEVQPGFDDLNAAKLASVRVRRNDWVRRKNEISVTYIDMLHGAKSHVTILCSYFLPGKIIRRALRNAAARGVKIKVITAGNSDISMAKHAERWMYDWLLRYGIELYEYQPSVLHAKTAVCDNAWFTIGSYNINDISTYASIELNLDVHDESYALELHQQLDDIIGSDCIAITPQVHISNTNIFIRFVRWLSYKFFRVAFVLVTFYYKKDKP